VRLDHPGVRTAALVATGFAASALWSLHATYQHGGDVVLAYAMARACGAGTAGALAGWVVAVVLAARRR